LLKKSPRGRETRERERERETAKEVIEKEAKRCNEQ